MKKTAEAALIILLVLSALASAAFNLIQRQKIHRLNAALEYIENKKNASNRSMLDEFMVQELREKGLTDPERQIIDDLAKHPEIIDEEGVVGGEMGFYDISSAVLLNDRWVYAPFDDGHIAGYLIAEYSVSKGGEISWKVIKTEMR